MLWVELCLLLKDVEILTPSACECDLFGNGIFADDQLKMRSLTWKTWTQHTQGKCHVNVKAEIGVPHGQAEERQRLPANHQKPGERLGTDSLTPAEGTSPADISILDF